MIKLGQNSNNQDCLSISKTEVVFDQSLNSLH